MRFKNLCVSLFIATGIVGCGGDKIASGGYLAKAIDGDKAALLSVTGNAAFYAVMGYDGKFKNPTHLDISYKDERIFFDDKEKDIRYVFKRDVDEIGLVCINCEEPGRKFPVKWNFAQEEAFDLAGVFKEQKAAEAAAALQAERERRDLPKLAHFKGDWVAVRPNKHWDMMVVTVSDKGRNQGVKFWHLDASRYGKIKSIDQQRFQVEGDELVIILGDTRNVYKLSEDGDKLLCTSCGGNVFWKKGDPEKVNDWYYLQEFSLR